MIFTLSFKREGVEQLLLESSEDHAIICDLDTLEKIAMRGLSLALSHGECFGMFGPNGADKNYFISMAVEEFVESVNLFHGGTGDKQAGKYSGEMNRRLLLPFQ
ncbi:ABC transporter A family member 8 [Vitis vinifera]|uniref:ABC transporter A family member 8 n=1 Tax=Vitis vinifera TaxID=29760 RepID=UPI002883438B|nr:ABC transporter A family member 8 [Vitis vinifera]